MLRKFAVAAKLLGELSTTELHSWSEVVKAAGSEYRFNTIPATEYLLWLNKREELRAGRQDHYR